MASKYYYLFRKSIVGRFCTNLRCRCKGKVSSNLPTYSSNQNTELPLNLKSQYTRCRWPALRTNKLPPVSLSEQQSSNYLDQKDCVNSVTDGIVGCCSRCKKSIICQANNSSKQNESSNHLCVLSVN